MVYLLALYDIEKEEIYARDTFGIRPLFYGYSKEGREPYVFHLLLNVSHH